MTISVGFLIVGLCLILLCIVAVGRVTDPAGGSADPLPDAPRSFGHDVCWLAIRTEHTVSVVEHLQLVSPRLENWSKGLKTVADPRCGDTQVFVSPPVQGWTFVIGLALPQPMGAHFDDKVTPLLAHLKRAFPDVQYYLNYPLFDYFSWQRCRDGRFVRVFAATDEGVVANKGAPTAEERALGLKLFELRGVRDRRGDAGGELLLHPTEEHVLMLAGAWSLDPTRLEAAVLAEGVGYIGTVPASWKVRPMKSGDKAA